MPKQALVIINPQAGMRKSRKHMFEIVDRLSRSGYTVSVQTTEKAGDGTRFVREYGADRDLIVCCGGDGTLNEIINGVTETGCTAPIGYVPAGTTNDFARTVQLPKKVEKCMDRILSTLPRNCDVGSFNGKDFSYIASAGAFTKVSYSTPQRMKNKFGHSAYLWEGIKEIGNISPFRAKVSFNGKMVEDEFVFISVSNSTSIAGLFKLNRLDVRLDDGEFELMLIRNPKNAVDLLHVVQGLTSGKYDPNYVVFDHVSQAHFQFESPIQWTLDGESGNAHSEVEIGVLDHQIQIFY